MRCIRHLLSASLCLSVGCLPVPDWEPVVRTKDDVQELARNTKAIRCIDIGDAELLAVGTRLQELDFIYVNSKSQISDVGVEGLVGLKSLKKIVVLDCSLMSDKSFQVFAKLPELTEVVLANGPRISSQGLASLYQNPQLRLVDLTAFPQMIESNVRKIQDARPGCKLILRSE